MAVAIKFGVRKIVKIGERGYGVMIPVEIVKTWKEKGVEEVEVVWVNDSLVIYPVYPRKS